MSTAKVLSTNGQSERLQAWTLIVVLLWFFAALAGSVAGVFDVRRGPPLGLGTAALLPVVIFAVGYLRWAAFREMVRQSNLRVLTLGHTWRLMAVVFLILYLARRLPGMFALPAGLGDIAIGATAP